MILISTVNGVYKPTQKWENAHIQKIPNKHKRWKWSLNNHYIFWLGIMFWQPRILHDYQNNNTCVSERASVIPVERRLGRETDTTWSLGIAQNMTNDPNGGFLKWGYPPKWIVCNGNAIKMKDLGPQIGMGHNWVSKNLEFRNGTCGGKLLFLRFGIMPRTPIKYLCWAISCACAWYKYFWHIGCPVSVLKQTVTSSNPTQGKKNEPPWQLWGSGHVMD